jgi:hypothetical protein
MKTSLGTADPIASYLSLSDRAAYYEKQELWDNAALLWQKASHYARNTKNVSWACARADYCQHQRVS